MSGTPDQPPDFSMAEGAVAMHEMFTSYVDAGFTESQALRLIIGQMKPCSCGGAG